VKSSRDRVERHDVVIVGGGPAGAVSAMYLLRHGIRPVIIEQETFPRYHIGESMIGETAPILKDLGLEEEMLRRRHPVKRAGKIFGTSEQSCWYIPVAGRDADWNLFEASTWQVRRSGFDEMMLKTARDRGAVVIPGQATKPLLGDGGAVRGVQVKLADGGFVDFQSELLLDCSGQATFLANAGVTGPKYLGTYDKQIAIFSQVVGAIRDSGSTVGDDPNNTVLFYREKYHWCWFIPLDAEVTSIGVVIPAAYFLSRRESKRDFLVRELHALNPELTRRLPEIKLVEDVHVIPNYSYQVRRFSGKGFICIGDAHRFIDPFFSFGMTMSMKEARFAAPLVRAYLEGRDRDTPSPFAEHELFCERAIDILEDTIDMLWEHPLAFAVFAQHRHRDPMTDLLAGRVHERQPSELVRVFRRMLGRERERELVGADSCSVPVGSRFHPERATIWEAKSQVATTEAWLGPR